MAVTTEQFAIDITKFAEKVRDRGDLVVRKIALEMLTRIIDRTPVDTGRARANWQVDLNSVPTGTVESIFEGAITGVVAQAVIGANLSRINGHSVVYIANNLPYIVRLEEGYSGQAPNGMVAVTVQEFPFVVRRAVNEAKGEVK